MINLFNGTLVFQEAWAGFYKVDTHKSYYKKKLQMVIISKNFKVISSLKIMSFYEHFVD